MITIPKLSTRDIVWIILLAVSGFITALGFLSFVPLLAALLSFIIVVFLLLIRMYKPESFIKKFSLEEVLEKYPDYSEEIFKESIMPERMRVWDSELKGNIWFIVLSVDQPERREYHLVQCSIFDGSILKRRVTYNLDECYSFMKKEGKETFIGLGLDTESLSDQVAEKVKPELKEMFKSEVNNLKNEEVKVNENRNGNGQKD